MCRQLCAVAAVLGMAFCAGAVEVLTSSDAVTWGRLYAPEVSLSWDWSWEWVPEAATRVRVSVVGARHRTVLDRTYARGEATSATLTVETPTAASEDVYTATLKFLAEDGTELASRTVSLAALAGSFGQARVCTQQPTHDDWRKVADYVLVPYDFTWSESTADASAGILTVAPAGGTEKTMPLAARSGVVAVKGAGETALALTADGSVSADWQSDLLWKISGLMLIFH